ncbi:DEAD/DEAH box helicase [Nitratifractor sp.]
MTFDKLGLDAPILKAVKAQGYDTPTPIQAQAIPVVLEGRDLLAAAQTGTGKTAGFTLPLLQQLSSAPKQMGRKQIRALVLTPTRELAAQVAESVRLYGKHLRIRSTVVYGGVGIEPQKRAIANGVEIVIATPGRLLDLANQKAIDLSAIETLILDEADRMLDMGFIHDIRKIIAMTPKARQTLLFSATFSPEIKRLASGMLRDPATVEVARQNTTAEQVSQRVHHVDKRRKQELLVKLIRDENWKQVLVFTRTKHGANKLSQQLERHGISSAAIHGNKTQSARMKSLKAFKENRVQVLVATDIAARGIDIAELPHVVNFELPNVAEDYVHRIGRTGRAGSSGEALSLVCVDEHQLLRNIERFIKSEIPKMETAGFEPDPSIKAEPIQNGRNRQGSGRSSRGGNGPRNRNHSGNRQRHSL